MTLIPDDWMPKAAAKRVVCHWTAGAYKASQLDRRHYHILIEDDGDLVRGTHTVADNDRTSDGVYAAHTRGLNTGSIGVAVCCMAGAEERPFEAGTFPMTQVQWERMAEVVAVLCHRYAIPVTPQTVLGHGEVQAALGVAQKGKWDPMILPWAPKMLGRQVGNAFRSQVQAELDRLARPAPEAVLAQEGTSALPFQAALGNQVITGTILFNEGAYLKISSLQDLGWSLAAATPDSATLTMGGDRIVLPVTTVDDVALGQIAPAALAGEIARSGYVSAVDFARARNLPIELAGDTAPYI